MFPTDRRPILDTLLGLLLLSIAWGYLGCAHEPDVPRPQPSLPSLSDTFRKTPIALIDLVILPQKLPATKKQLSVMFSDEQFASDGESWLFVPSSRIIQPNALLTVSFRSAGITTQSYPTLQAAKTNGARTALIVVQKEASVRFPDRMPFFWDPHTGRDFWGDIHLTDAIATVELLAFQVNLDTFQVIWTDTVKGTFIDQMTLPHPLYAPVEFTADVATGDIQPQIHPFRVVLTKAYFEASKSLLLIFERHVAGGAK